MRASRFHLVALAVIFLLSACRPDIEFVENSFRSSQAESSLSGGNLSVLFPSSAGSASVDLEATGKWSASFVNDRAMDWCSLSASEGKRGTATLTVKVQENADYDERSASINFTCGEVRRTIVVTQKQKDALLLSSARQDFGMDGGRFTIEVKTNVPYDYSISKQAEAWLTAVGTKGLSTHTLTFNVAANESFEKREGEITFTSKTGTEVVKVYQESDTPTIVLSSYSCEIPEEGGRFTVDVHSNVNVTFEIPDDCNWIHAINTKSMSTNAYAFSVDDNEQLSTRQADIQFKCAEWNLVETVRVTQKAETPTLIIGQTKYQFEPEGGNLSVEVASNMDLDIVIQPGCDWIDQVITKTVTERVHYFTVAKNHDRSDRSGWIVFKNDAQGKADTVRITQSFQPILVPCDTLRASGRGWTISFETFGSDPDQYRILPCDRWLSLSSQERVDGRSRFHIEVQAQSTLKEPRRTQVLVYDKYYSVPDTVQVLQYGKLHFFSFTTNAITVAVPEVEETQQMGFVDWGDGIQDYWSPGITHTYHASGSYTVSVEIRNKAIVPFKNLENGMTINLMELRQ